MTWNNNSVQNLINTSSESNPIDTIRELARALVIDAYNKGWEGPPFDPIKLAQILGIRVLPNESILDARIYSNLDETFIIEYNPHQKESRINFSIAHEIGHTFFPDWKNKVRNRENEKDRDTWELEFLCNIAASEILLPYAEFNNEANSIPLTLESILQISNKYKASVESVFLRFCEVVEKSCAILITSFSDSIQKQLVVEYSKSSKHSPLNIERGYIIPEDSKAYDCLHSGWTSYAIEQWEIFKNTKYKVYAIGLPSIKKQQKERIGIFLVPEFYSESLNGHIYMVNGDATRPRGDGNKIIVQVINTSGGLGFGFGRSMSKVWPLSKHSVISWMKDKNDFELGHSRMTQLSSDTYVFQMIAQKGIFAKEGSIPLRYDSLKDCLNDLKINALKLNASIHMPQIGAGQAKGDWGIIEGMIYEILVSEGIDVTVYVLPGSQIINPKKQSNLTLFDQDSLYEK
jgi:Zn-dependent peptidase ImmA (M78 family)